MCQCTDSHTWQGDTCTHLLACKELSLVLVDDGVTCGHLAVLVPSNWTQEVSRVGQTIGSCKTNMRSHTYAPSCLLNYFSFYVKCVAYSIAGAAWDFRCEFPKLCLGYCSYDNNAFESLKHTLQKLEIYINNTSQQLCEAVIVVVRELNANVRTLPCSQ